MSLHGMQTVPWVGLGLVADEAGRRGRRGVQMHGMHSVRARAPTLTAPTVHVPYIRSLQFPLFVCLVRSCAQIEKCGGV